MERRELLGLVLPVDHVLGLVLSGLLHQLLPGHEGEHPHAQEVLLQLCLHHRVENLFFMY